MAYALRHLKIHEQKCATHELELATFLPLIKNDIYLRYRRLMEYLKDYNFQLSYHPVKANVVENALRWKGKVDGGQ